MHHIYEWPADNVDFEVKKVALIGACASGVQVIQGVGSIAKELTVFIPEYNRKLLSEANKEFKAFAKVEA